MTLEVSTWTLDFEQVGRGSLAQVGGKGANLGEMVGAGMPVPPGFCVTTAAFSRFMADCEEAGALMREIDALAPAQLEQARRLGAALRSAIESRAIPPEIEESITRAFAALEVRAGSGQRAYAVRSSATLEDLAEASFAGQQDSYLNVCGLEVLLDRVRACWASLFTDRAIAYRKQRGFGSQAVALSVVVQAMVQSEVSGIMFSADPISGHRGVVSIDASYGLGEALVSGIVDADNYRIDRRSGATIEFRLGAKAIEIVACEQGTQTLPVDEDRRARRALSEALVRALVELAQRVEAHYGAPQDLEWCFEGEALFLVQTRPITTLFPIPPSAPGSVGEMLDAPDFEGWEAGEDLRGPRHVFLSFNHLQVMTDPITPLGMDAMVQIFPVGKRRDRGPCTEIRVAGGRIYIDASAALLRRPLRKLLPSMLRVMDPKMSVMLEVAVAGSSFTEREGRPPANIRVFLRRMVWPVLRRVIPNLLWADPERMQGRVESRMGEVTREWGASLAAADPAGDDPKARLQAVRELLWAVMPTLFADFFYVMAAGMLSWRVLSKVSGGDRRVQDLSRGLEGNVTTQMDLELGDLADLARAEPELREALLADVDLLRDPEKIVALAGGAELRAGWEAFLDRYGHRGIGEIDLGRVRWDEDPSSLLQSLEGMLRDPERGGHRRRHTQAGADAEAAAAGLLADAGPLRRVLLRHFIVRMRALLGLREHPKFMVMQSLLLARRELQKLAVEMVADGSLAQVEDIWWLDLGEIESGLGGSPSGGGGGGDGDGDPVPALSRRAAARRVRYASYANLRPPRVVTSEGEVPRPVRSEVLEPGTYGGVSASTGVVEGRARVIMDPQREVLEAGEILIAPFTDPGWTPLFIHAAALVMEVGGLMTHGSVVAREYGIPAVVGVDHATTEISTGQWIRVDGDLGLVTILPEPEPSELSEHPTGE